MTGDESNNTNNQNQQDSNSNTQQESGANNFSGGGKKVVVGIDRGGGDDQKYMTEVAEGLKSCGYEVTTTCVDPNQEGIMQGKGADFNVFLCNGVGAATIWSFTNAIKAGSLPHTIFAFEGWYHDEGEPDGTLADLQHCLDEEFVPEHDSGQFMGGSSTSQMAADAEAQGVKTVGDWMNANSEYVSACYAKTTQEMAQNICEGQCGSGTSSGGGTDTGNGGAQIKDKTFEQCIRRICAATDSVFLVENNAAVLFPYVDWLAFTLREKVQTITPKEIDPDVFSIEYQTQGTYNKVTIAWGGTSLPERFPDNELMHKKYIEAQKEKTETKTKKPGTTQKMSTDTDGTNLLSEQYDALVKRYGELEKRVETPVEDLETAQYMVNALLIQYVRDFNNACQCRSLANRKYIGGTFYVVTNPFTYDKEMFYLNGYTIRTQKDEPIYFDLDFRYGPESAEDLLDLQTLSVGGSSSGGSSGVMGGEAASINEIAKKACGNESDPMKKANLIHEYLRKYITYSLYECSKPELGKDPEKIWKHVQGGGGINCADTATLTSAVMRAAGLKAQVVWAPGHFWTLIEINGQEVFSDLTSDEGLHSFRGLGEVWQNMHYSEKNGNKPRC